MLAAPTTVVVVDGRATVVVVVVELVVAGDGVDSAGVPRYRELIAAELAKTMRRITNQDRELIVSILRDEAVSRISALFNDR